MALLKYLQQEGPVRECGTLSKKETEQVNECVRRVLVPSSATRGTYTGYTPKERAKIGRYAAENGPARTSRHFSVPETTASLQRRTGPLYCCFLSHMPALLLLSGSKCPCKRGDHECS